MCTNKIEQSPTHNEKDEIVSVVSWIDLLGYGQQISVANFDPKDPEAKKPNSRLKAFRDAVNEYGEQKKFHTLMLNDGAVIYRDLTFDSADTLDFLEKSWGLYSEINKIESIGARMVLASGFRFPGSNVGIEHTKEKFKQILEMKLREFYNKLNDKSINCENAISDTIEDIIKDTIEDPNQRVYPFRPPSGILPHLEENFAFSKAYIAERSGSEGNLPGANFYVDLNIFKSNKKFEPYVEWSCNRLKLAIEFAKFTMKKENPIKIKLDDMNNKHEIGKRLKCSLKRFRSKQHDGFHPSV